MPEKNPPAMPTVLAGAKVPASLYVEGDKPDDVKIIVVDVWVRQMPARHLLEKVLYHQDDEAMLITVCCTNMRGQPELPENWVDSLTDESHVELLEKVRALNFSRMIAQAQRVQKIQKNLEVIAPPMKSSPTSSPTAPSSSTAPTTSS